MNRFTCVIGVTAVVAGLGMSGQATAVTVNRQQSSHGTANCQAALPVFDTNIRHRPLALVNEGTSTAFITCDTESIDNFSSGFNQVTVSFTNRSAAAVTVSCSLVNGLHVGSNPSNTFPKTTGSIPAGSNGSVQWTTVDNGGANFAAPATSCALPPAVEIGSVSFRYPENVGA